MNNDFTLNEKVKRLTRRTLILAGFFFFLFLAVVTWLGVFDVMNRRIPYGSLAVFISIIIFFRSIKKRINKE